MRGLFELADIDVTKVDGIIVASVVPPIDAALAVMAQRYFQTDAVFVNHQTDTGLKICYDDPKEVGADRVVNAVAALHKYGGPCIVVDLGTAITFDAISAKSEYLGGIIAAGIGISSTRCSPARRACRAWTSASRRNSSGPTPSAASSPACSTER